MSSQNLNRAACALLFSGIYCWLINCVTSLWTFKSYKKNIFIKNNNTTWLWYNSSQFTEKFPKHLEMQKGYLIRLFTPLGSGGTGQESLSSDLWSRILLNTSKNSFHMTVSNVRSGTVFLSFIVQEHRTHWSLGFNAWWIELQSIFCLFSDI